MAPVTKVNVGLKYEDLMNKIKTYINDKKELNLITKAYNYAKE